MPELPDVEIARRDLARWVRGATITEARSSDAYLVRPGSTRAWIRALGGRTVRDVGRKGKWLRLVLDDGGRLFSHLGMTGDWVKVASDAPAQRFERARIDVLRRGRHASIRYLDARRLGRLISSPADIDEWTSMGPDPLANGVDADALAAALSRKRTVKELLMDQTVLAGIGNIIATEALWLARVDPRSPGTTLLPADVRAIARSLDRVIARELDDRGAPFFVYGRAGEACPRCATTLASVRLGGRTSVLCGTCQVRASRADRGSREARPRRRTS